MLCTYIGWLAIDELAMQNRTFWVTWLLTAIAVYIGSFGREGGKEAGFTCSKQFAGAAALPAGRGCEPLPANGQGDRQVLPQGCGHGAWVSRRLGPGAA